MKDGGKNKKKKQYHYPSKKSGAKTYAGLIRVSGKGHGFFEHEEIKETVEIFPENLNTALHGDTGEISLLAGMVKKANKEDYLKGEVIKVSERAKSVFVGVVEKD